MKLFKYSFLIISLAFIISCNDDVLNLEPLDKISASQVWKDQAMVEGYVTNLYSRFPFFAFQNYWYSISDEATTSTGNGNSVTLGTVNKNNEAHDYWPYEYIRDINIFLENITSAEISEDAKKQLEGEVRFIRAYVYFEMMKRYGGVPLVDVVIDPFEPVEDKYTVRAKEEEIANFIDSECAKASALLTNDTEPLGRVNKWTALALQARANLWAASIAKFGTVHLNGIVGIPSSAANSYYQKAADASSAIINSGKYSLYNGNPSDKEENYYELFFVETHDELIFVRPYDGVNIGHSWNEWQGPNQWAKRGGTGDPTLDFILRYENIDGSNDQPVFGPDNLYNNGREPFANKDPRLFGTVFFERDEFGTITVETYEGLDPSDTPTPSSVIRNPSESYNGIPTVGRDSRSLTKDDFSTNSGFLIKKFVDDSQIKIETNRNSNNWIVFRLAEMYLIKAEAEFELDNLEEAVNALNKTRERAGISLVDASSITREKVRNERTSELAFEVHRYWDLIRWRTAEDVLTHRFQGLQIILHEATMKYYFIPFDCESFSRTFKPEHYYNPITSGRIDNNPKLIENPFY